MDLTVLHLAVPKLSAALRPGSAELLWIIDVYGFLVAGSLITMGTLGDRIGRRRLLLIGAAAFSLASVLAAFSTTAEMLIASRAVMGVAGATLAPGTLSLIFNMFLDPKQRRVAIGVWISSFSAGGAIGPLLGGVLLEHYWWGAVFLLALPVMALLLVLGPRVLPEFRDPNARRLDLPSAAMSLSAVLAVIYGLKDIAQDGFGFLPALIIIVGVALGALFVRRQSVLADPLIDIKLFRIPSFRVSLVTYMLGVLITFGYFLFIPQYLQLVLGLTPLRAGVWTVPSMAAFVIGSTLAPRFVHRVQPATLMSAGLAVAAGALATLALAGGPPTLVLLIVVGFVASLGLAPVFALTTELIVGSAPPERAGAASGISETSAELGGALGIAILGSLGTAIYRSALADSLPAGIPLEVAQVALKIDNADFFGYSMGAGVALQITLQYPDLVRKLVFAAAGYDLDGFHPGILAGIEKLKPEDFAGSPWIEEYKKIAPDPNGFPRLLARIKQQVGAFKGFPPEAVRSIKAPTLIIIADSDVIRPEHAVQMFRLLGGGVAGDVAGLPPSRLAVLPGTTHVTLADRADWLVSMTEEFLDAPMPKAK